MLFNARKRREYYRLLKREWREAEGFNEHFWLAAQWALNGLIALCVLVFLLGLLVQTLVIHAHLVKVFWVLVALTGVVLILFALRAIFRAIGLFRQF